MQVLGKKFRYLFNVILHQFPHGTWEQAGMGRHFNSFQRIGSHVVRQDLVYCGPTSQGGKAHFPPWKRETAPFFFSLSSECKQARRVVKHHANRRISVSRSRCRDRAHREDGRTGRSSDIYSIGTEGRLHVGKILSCVSWQLSPVTATGRRHASTAVREKQKKGEDIGHKGHPAGEVMEKKGLEKMQVSQWEVRKQSRTWARSHFHSLPDWVAQILERVASFHRKDTTSFRYNRNKTPTYLVGQRESQRFWLRHVCQCQNIISPRSEGKNKSCKRAAHLSTASFCTVT